MDEREIRNRELFKDLKVKATVGNILTALQTLTPVEFRLWAAHCETFDNFHPSHFAGVEAKFIKTGKWDWVPEKD